ncbi:MAG: hypothetical protein RR357_00305 [Clostridia bacterium]
MIHLIYGAKGSGKTKRIIDMANESIENAHGDIVFITDTNRYMFSIKYQVRVINSEENHIFDEEALIGFIKGLIAGNHDIKTIYIDGVHRITKTQIEDMQHFYDVIDNLAAGHEIDFVISVSKDLDEMPEFLKKYL